MKKSFLDRLIDRPHKRSDTVTWVVMYLVVIVMMGNLPPVVDKIYHPEIIYFDEEHVVVGFTISVVASLLLGALLLYSIKLSKTLTRERVVEASRQASNDRYYELFYESMDMVFIITRDGDFVDINPAGANLLGFDSAEEMMDVNFETGLVANRDELSAFYAEIDKTGFVKDYELSLKRRDGAGLLVAVNATVVRDNEGRIEAYRGVMRDITDRRYLDQQVMEAQRVESIVKLSQGIAHQFNNVITTIQGYAEFAVNELPDGSPAIKSLLRIVNAADRAERLTRELLVFSHKKQSRPRPLDLNQLVAASQEMIGRIIGDEVVLSTRLSSDAAIANVDAVNIESALLNLIMFARERLRDHGEIRVITSVADIDSEEYIRAHPSAYRGRFVTLAVEDNGPLIEQRDFPRIFEPFPGEMEEQVSGLEMSVVHGVVMNHDGWIDIESGPELTRFTIYLPALRVDSDNFAALGAETVPEELRGQGQKVLLVEDEEAVRAMAATMLQNNGYVVYTARNANDAFQIFAREKGEIDAVFSDVVMPGENGISLVDHLAEYNPELPVILTSGHENTVDDWRSIEEHGYRFLPKPYRLTELLREINSVFSKN